MQVQEHIIEAAQKYLSCIASVRGGGNPDPTPILEQAWDMPSSHGMEFFRVSCVAHFYPNVYTVDILTMRKLIIGGEFFAYEDDGWPCWFEDDKEPMEALIDDGPFTLSDENGQA